MTYTKRQFGLELNSRLLRGDSPREFAKWAYQLYVDSGLDFEAGLNEPVLRLMAMDEGPEFSMTNEELRLLAGLFTGAEK